MRARRSAQRSRQLTLEKLEDRILLAGVDPGDSDDVLDGDILGGDALPPDPEPTETRSPDEWTFMVYLDADNNLETYGIDDFLEMASVGSDSEVNIVVLFDRISGYDTGYGNWTDTHQGIVDLGDEPDETWGTSMGELNMGDPQTLLDFATWATTTYPADNYALVIWDHGGGWRSGDEQYKGLAWDDTNGSDYLETWEVGWALENVAVNIDLLGADACLMQMIEFGYEVIGDASMLVGSEEVEPAGGWPYDWILGDLTDNPTWGALELSENIVTNYGDWSGSYTQSAIDLDELGDVASALDNFATVTMANATAADIAQLDLYWWNAPYFGSGEFIDIGGYFDLVAEDVTITASIRTAADAVNTEYAEAVAYNYSDPWIGGTGQSIYIQYLGWSPDPDYSAANLEFANDTQWDEYLAWWGGESITPPTPPGGGEDVNPGEPAILSDGGQLFFIQGEAEEPEGDGPGPLTTIIIVSFEGPGFVNFTDSVGNPYTDGIANGSKIGDIYFYNVTDGSSLLMQTGKFKEGYSMDMIAEPVTDLPDTPGEALSITVPEGQSGAAATYNTGRAVVAASAAVNPDWVTFDAQEAEQINVVTTGPSVNIYTKYGPWPMVLRGVDSYTIGDDNGNTTLDDVTVYLEVVAAGGVPYTMVIDRVEQNGVLGNITVAEDFPDSYDTALDLGYDAATSTGIGAPTPTFSFFGEGGGDDYFSVTLGVGETLVGSSFTNITEVPLLDADGMQFGELIGAGGEFTNPMEEDLVLIMDVVSTANWSFDISIRGPLLSEMVELNTDPVDGHYIWWSGPGSGTGGLYPWMAPPPPGQEEPVRAPAGSGGAVITGNVYFNSDSTGFERFAVDGSLKGSIGRGGSTLGTDETIDEIMVGYIHGTGGAYTEGNINRLLVKTTVGEPDDGNLYSASFTVYGYLLDFQASGSISADMNVWGISSESVLVIDTDEQIGMGEMHSYSVNEGRINDTPEAAFIVGSPSGDFNIEGFVSTFLYAGSDKTDPEDWYVFNAGLGQEISISVEMSGYTAYVWVYAPSGRVLAVVDAENSTTFKADEGGNYYIMVGRPEMPDRLLDWSYNMDYTVKVRGASPVGLGGVVAGSDIFGVAAAAPRFGEDEFAWTVIKGSDIGFIEVRGAGVIRSADFYTTGNLGYLSADSMGGIVPRIDVSGNLDRVETRGGDFLFDYVYVAGNLGELQSAGNMGFCPLSLPSPIIVLGSAGAIVAEDDCWVQISVYTTGIDLLYVGGDFGSPGSWARLDTEAGTDVGFVYIEGDIYYDGLEVMDVPVADQATHVDDGGAVVQLRAESTVPLTDATLSYRYLPVGRPQLDWLANPDPVGAVITEITATDSLSITVNYGRVDLPYIRFGNNEKSYLVVKGKDSLAECDIYFVDALAASVASIVNDTHQGDIVNVNVGSAEEISTGGHIGISERFFTAGGRLPNPTPDTFAPTPVEYVSEENPMYFNGIVATGDVGIIEAGGSIGDVYVTGTIGEVTADSDGVANGTFFCFRGKVRDARTWDGIAGVVYGGVDIGDLNLGDGVYGGFGDVPVGGVFTGGIIEKISVTGATIEGPIMAAGGIGKFTANQTVFRNATIGAGADFSDWTLWDESLLTTDGVRLEQFQLKGAGSILDSTVFQVGVLGKLTLSSDTSGWVDSRIWSIGDSLTEEGINPISIQGGGMDGTGAPPWWGGNDIRSSQRIGRIDVKNGDMVNVSVQSLKTIDKLSVKGGDITATSSTSISAPLGIGTISADNITGGSQLYIGAAQVKSMKVKGNVTPDVTADGAIMKMDVKGTMSGDLEIIGPNGYLGKLSVGNGLSGDVIVANYIGSIDVKSGNLSGDVTAGGSNSKNLAIGSIKVKGGSLTGDVTTEVNVATVRPGGGIGKIDVGTNLTGDIMTTSYYNGVTGLPVTANIGSIGVKSGNMSGAVAITQNAPADSRDPGGTLSKLSVKSGVLSSAVSIEKGSLGTLDAFTVQNASVSVAAGNIAQIKAKGSILSSLFSASGSLSKVTVSGNYTDTSLVAATIGKVQVKGIISDPGSDDVINATNALSSFQVSDATGSAVVSALNNHVDFAGVDAYVG